jgi:hypothetical protein
VPAGNTNPIEPDLTQYQYARWTGTLAIAKNPVQTFTTSWYAYGSGTGAPNGLSLYGLTVGGNPPNQVVTGDVLCYNLTSSVDGGSYICGSVGLPPFQWRASVYAESYVGSSLALHTLGGVYPYATPFINFGWVGNEFFNVSGSWQFSNDQSTVVFTWAGK